MILQQQQSLRVFSHAHYHLIKTKNKKHKAKHVSCGRHMIISQTDVTRDLKFLEPVFVSEEKQVTTGLWEKLELIR